MWFAHLIEFAGVYGEMALNVVEKAPHL